jgi:dienelactone hydrolase
MLTGNVRVRVLAANERDLAGWHEVHTRADWERFRNARIESLRRSLGSFPSVPKDLQVRITGTVTGEGYHIDNLVFVSRPGLVVTANLYGPDKPVQSMPGILICHSHHQPKTQGELQDMGMTWARLGCLVLVMDQLGHGERAQHPFHDQSGYPRPFRVDRQDYYFRYNIGMQLQLLGDSLMGWLAWDISRGVDVLLARQGIDRQRIILLGAVAGGGDPAAVAAALDPRIAAVVPFNFGGPQPETPYPLPPAAEQSFNYVGSGSWESTRNLRLSARDGFLPWLIVGSVAPRRLVYGHEFSWDRQRDPVWARLQRIYGFYGEPDRLAASHGRGRLSGRPPESTHCTNIGPDQRRAIYVALNRWFAIPVPAQEFHQRQLGSSLTCLTSEAAAALRRRPLHELATELGQERMAAARAGRAQLTPAMRLQRLRREWTDLLGDVEPVLPTVMHEDQCSLGEMTVARVKLEAEPGIVLPLVLLIPASRSGSRCPVVVGVAQGGKQEFLRMRSAIIAGLLKEGVAICLPDLRGTGETRPGDDRGRASLATAISSSELMLGQTLVGSRLRDLRTVLRYLRTRKGLDATHLGLWGDSFAPSNPTDRNVAVPLDADNLPELGEPLGGLLALWGALFEEDVHAVWVQGGLLGYHSLLQSPFCYQPHDVIVPAALTAGDLCDVAAALAPRPLRLEGLVDGLNRRVAPAIAEKVMRPARTAYRSARAEGQLQIGTEDAVERIIPFFLAGLAATKRPAGLAIPGPE